ncbi:MAG: hypothetical protein GXP62_00755 [Oligoflexia bacterium]|nr:hypothetical protein [Oligoflexia bacterium]
MVAHREIPVVGRNPELDRLWAAAVLRQRQPVLVDIAGASGLGRTRLVDELTRTMERVGIAQGVRLDYAGRASPDQGIDGAIRRLLPPLPNKRAYRSDIARTLARLRGDSPTACRHDATSLAELLTQGPTGPNPDRATARSFIVEHLRATAWRGLTWLWLDDVHLAGESDDGWTLIEMIFATRSPTLILCSYVDEPAHRTALRPLRRLLARHSKRSYHIGLELLSDTDARKLARAHLPMAEALAAELAASTGGHPRFMHDLIVHLVRQGALKPGNKDINGIPQWTWAADAAPLPADRFDFARQRLALVTHDRPELVHALLTVRLAGTGAPERVVTRVTGSTLDELVTLGLIRVQGDGLVIDSPALKQAISELERPTELNRTIHDNLAAAWLEEGDTPQAQARAGLHLALAGEAARALPLLHHALAQSVDSLGRQSLARLARRTMDLAKTVAPEKGDPLEHAWVDAALIRSDALWRLGKADSALALDHDITETALPPDVAVRAACQHALHLGPFAVARTGMDRLAEVEPLLLQVPLCLRARFYATRASLQAQLSQADAALVDVECALALEPTPDVRAQALLLRARHTSAEDAVRAAETARAVQELANQHGLLEEELSAWEILAHLAVPLGQTKDRIAEIEAAIVRLGRIGERTKAGRLLVCLGDLHRDCSDLELAASAYTDALRLVSTGRESWTFQARIGLAMLATTRGDGARLRTLVDLGRRATTPSRARLWTLFGILADTLQGAAPVLPDRETLEQAALSGPAGLFATELLVMSLLDADHPDADHPDASELLAHLRELAQGQGVERHAIDPLLARASLALATSRA